MVNLPKCSMAGCDSPVSKAGYTLCYKHWLVENKSKVTKQVKEVELDEPKQNNFLTSTALGEKLGINSRKLNQVLSELGWIERSKKGWIPTSQGKKLHAESRESRQSGVPFVMWPEAIITSKILTNTIQELLGNKGTETKAKLEDVPTETKDEKQVGYRDKLDKFKPTHRAMDGHWVRSKAEGLIDNWLYMSGIVHAYERLLPVEEELYCDFYVPAGKVYIEFWGLENDPKYRERKEKKKQIYKKYGFNLIELNDEHIQNLDDYLPKMLLKFNVIVD
ncbi:hypothetical protein [Methylotenera sp.]|uniref:hypothetical protein n=1 Tax=Methylotenera sp. TaxID=2051956 RepID=UPI002725ED45|nr:hypothetical protein [Methylotenera sp.]MDO9203823.1 hypothetical protein [Methylotenera sp.]MDP2070639.1 hypothetical protein [Methylotenera sp.]MDP2231277.1 hypothetical protein [Methylotenera sp.]MDP3004880.1 hypothetical protein [Methylotenera sp.]MDP3140357.1 hypothetical protein [Methylotenera sp.]